MAPTKRGRGRPKGSRNKTSQPVTGEPSPKERGAAAHGPVQAAGTTRAGLEADRDRLLKSIEDAGKAECPECHRGGDPKIEAALQSQLNGVHRMLLRISGETAPSDTNMIRSPQFGRFMAQLCDVLAKNHPKAWLDVQALAAAEAR